MAATGASGTLAVGYGTMRENIIRMKVVTAEGEIFQTGSRARKSSAGYDLSHIFIGSEGTLGIIMEITLKVYEIPTTAAAVCSFADLEKASRTIATARAKGIHAQRIELLNARAIEAVNKKFNTTHTVTPKLFLEFHGVNEEEVQLHAAAFKKIADENQATEFAIATAEKERNELWACRHGAYWASASICPQCKLFVTVRFLRVFYDITNTLKQYCLGCLRSYEPIGRVRR
jgi:D-lactate dehydrogenase (cytochrome)